MKTTASMYFTKKTPCTITPTFCYVNPYIRGRTLDVGTGTGEYLERFPAGSVGTDISQKNISIVREKGLGIVNADFNERLPFDDRTFDTVFCSHVLEHIDSPLGLLKEMNRVLKETGHLVLALPSEVTFVNLFTKGYYKGHTGHLYGFSAQSINSLFKQADFETKLLRYNFPLINRFVNLNLIAQKIVGVTAQYFSTMYWIVGQKKQIDK